MSDTGIVRKTGYRFGWSRKDSVDWDKIQKIEILTTDSGPLVEDLFYLFHGPNESGVAIPNELAAKYSLLSLLQNRFPDLKNDMVINANCSIENARFVIWERE